MEEVKDYRDDYVRWNDSMKSTYKILAPDMLPWHFKIFEKLLKDEGYDVEILQNKSRAVIDEGLKHVHNDTCYPCLCVVGQYIDALKSGKYDLDHTAILITQTGGGCRASNYLPLIRKALKAEFPQVPVVSVNFSGLEKDSSLPISAKLFLKLACGIIYGDAIMWCYNQTKPYEVVEGEADKTRDEALEYVFDVFSRRGWRKYASVTREIISRFSKIKRSDEKKIRVGIVGEIYVKYSGLGNNELEKFLLSEGCEPVVPALMDFVLFVVINNINDGEMYGYGKTKTFVYKLVYKFLLRIQRKIIGLYKKDGNFQPPHDIEELRKFADLVINQGVKMGEGWLIPAEMAAFAATGVPNVVCAQPFGCLPNHIAGKGAVRAVKKLFENENVVAVDYDPSATRVNQENRIKLMLATARENLSKQNPPAPQKR